MGAQSPAVDGRGERTSQQVLSVLLFIYHYLVAYRVPGFACVDTMAPRLTTRKLIKLRLLCKNTT